MSGRFEGKVAVVTGAAGGIGRATAQRFAAEGARVVLVDLPGEALDEAGADIRQAGAEVLTLGADVTRWADVERYAAEAVQRFGGIDCFFNNAGIEGVVKPLVEYPEEVFDRVIAVNLKGVWLGMKAVAARMQRGGAIVNTASTAGLRATPRLIPYGASKHAVIGMTRTAAVELAAAGIRVNAVCPGPIETRVMRSIERQRDPEQPEAAKAQGERSIPLGRYGHPEEVASLVLFLCSPDAAYLTGGYYLVDGGRTA